MAGHTAAFIAEMKEKLLEEQALLQKELATLTAGEGESKHTVFPDYGRNEEENANEVADFQALAATSEANNARLESIQEAFERIEAGTYGMTDDGELIPEPRLRANPAATTLVK